MGTRGPITSGAPSSVGIRDELLVSRMPCVIHLSGVTVTPSTCSVALRHNRGLDEQSLGLSLGQHASKGMVG